MTQNRKTILNARKAVSKAKTATRKAERKGKQYLDKLIMAETEAMSEEEWPYMVLREYQVTFDLTGTANKVKVINWGNSLVTDTIPCFPEHCGTCDYDFDLYHVDCYALDEEHAKEIALNRLQTVLTRKVKRLTEQAAFAEFQAANLPEFLGLA